MSMEWRDVLAEFFKYLRSPKDDVVGAITEGISKISYQLISGCKRFSGAQPVLKFLKDHRANDPGNCLLAFPKLQHGHENDQ